MAVNPEINIKHTTKCSVIPYNTVFILWGRGNLFVYKVLTNCESDVQHCLLFGLGS